MLRGFVRVVASLSPLRPNVCDFAGYLVNLKTQAVPMGLAPLRQDFSQSPTTFQYAETPLNHVYVIPDRCVSFSDSCGGFPWTKLCFLGCGRRRVVFGCIVARPGAGLYLHVL